MKSDSSSLKGKDCSVLKTYKYNIMSSLSITVQGSIKRVPECIVDAISHEWCTACTNCNVYVQCMTVFTSNGIFICVKVQLRVCFQEVLHKNCSDMTYMYLFSKITL